MLKKCLILSLAFVLLVVLFGCSSSSSEAEKSFDGAMKALKNNDQEAIELYFEDDTYGGPSSDINETLLSLIYENLEYKVISSEKDENNDSIETLEVNITNLDLGSIVPEYFGKVMGLTFSQEGQNMTSEEMDVQIDLILIEIIERLDVKTTHTVTVTMVKGDDDNWQVRADDTLMDAVFGGMVSAMDEF